MNSEDESIKILEKRIQHQLNLSREKNITPENIKYFVSSTALHRETTLPYTVAAIERPQNGHIATVQETDNTLPRNSVSESSQSGKSDFSQMATEAKMGNEDYWQKLRSSQIKEDLQRAGNFSETTETQHKKGKNEYKKVLHAINTEAFPENEMPFFFSEKI